MTDYAHTQVMEYYSTQLVRLVYIICYLYTVKVCKFVSRRANCVIIWLFGTQNPNLQQKCKKWHNIISNKYNIHQIQTTHSAENIGNEVLVSMFFFYCSNTDGPGRQRGTTLTLTLLYVKVKQNKSYDLDKRSRTFCTLEDQATSWPLNDSSSSSDNKIISISKVRVTSHMIICSVPLLLQNKFFWWVQAWNSLTQTPEPRRAHCLLQNRSVQAWDAKNFFLPSVKKLLRLESSGPRLESLEELGRVWARPDDDTSPDGWFSLLTHELISSCK